VTSKNYRFLFDKSTIKYQNIAFNVYVTEKRADKWRMG